MADVDRKGQSLGPAHQALERLAEFLEQAGQELSTEKVPPRTAASMMRAAARHARRALNQIH